MKKLLLLVTLFGLVGCGKFETVNQELTPRYTPPTFDDPYVIIDRVQIEIGGGVHGLTARVKHISPFELLFPKAFAYSGSTAPSASLAAITYNNAATAVGFTLNAGGLVSAGFTVDTLNFGTFLISGLDDNNLKVCPASGEANNGSVKCNHAKIRVYSATGDANGVFQNTTDGYYIPLSVSGLPVGVGVANAAYIQDYTIAASKNRLRVADLTAVTANFPITMNFSNGGAGLYSATLIVEYVLIKQ